MTVVSVCTSLTQLFIIVSVFRLVQAHEIIKIGAVLSENIEGMSYLEFAASINRSLEREWSGGIQLSVKVYVFAANDSEAKLQQIACSMVEEGMIGFVSAIDNEEHSRFLVDLGRAVNLLHIVSVTHMHNLYQGLVNMQKRLEPVVYSDYTYRQLNSLLYDYISSEKFKWKRIMIVYEPEYGLDVLYDFIVRSRESARMITALALPSMERDHRFDQEWNDLLDKTVLAFAAQLQDRYFIIHASFEYAEAFLTRALWWKMTRPSYFYLITTPISHEFEHRIIVQLVTDKIEKPNIYFVHRFTTVDDNSMLTTFEASLDFLLEFAGNSSSQLQASERERTERPESESCAVAGQRSRIAKQAQNLSQILATVGANLTTARPNMTVESNYFQRLFANSRYALQNRMSVVSMTWRGVNYTHSILYPCSDCSTDDLKDSSIRVAAYLDEPCVVLNKRPGEPERPFDGFCVELLEAVAKYLKVELIWSFVPDNVTGRLDDQLGWNGVIKMLIDKNADISGNLIEIDSLRAKYLEFSEPVLQTTFEALVQQRSNATPEIMAFTKPFTRELWGALVAAIILCSSCYWAISQLIICTRSDDCCVCVCACSCASAKGSKPAQTQAQAQAHSVSASLRKRYTYGQCVWYSTSSFFRKNIRHEQKFFSSKLLSTFVTVCAVILVCCYTANLTAFLATERRNPEIRNIDQLADSDKILRILDSSATGAFLKRSKSIRTYRRIWDTVKGYPKEAGFIKNTSAGIDLAKRGEAVWIGDSRIIRYWLAKRECAQPNSMTIVGKPFGSHALAYAFQKNSEIRDRFTTAILQVIESGRLSRYIDEWYNLPKECDVESALIKEYSLRKTDKMSLSTSMGIMVVVCVGIAIAIGLIVAKAALLCLDEEKLRKLMYLKRKKVASHSQHASANDSATQWPSAVSRSDA